MQLHTSKPFCLLHAVTCVPYNQSEHLSSWYAIEVFIATFLRCVLHPILYSDLQSPCSCLSLARFLIESDLYESNTMCISSYFSNLFIILAKNDMLRSAQVFISGGLASNCCSAIPPMIATENDGADVASGCAASSDTALPSWPEYHYEFTLCYT